MSLELWTSGELYDALRDDRMDPVPSYFLDTFFQEVFFSDDKNIMISELPAADRKLAPFVLPTVQGKPIFSEKGERVKYFTPAYIKPKDAVRAVDSRRMSPSEIFANMGQRPSTAERFDARVIEVMNYHRRAIMMRKAWMAARAFLDGQVTITYEADQGEPFSEVTINFGRDPNLNIALDTTFWDDPDYDIIGDLSDWSNLMYATKFGGRPSTLMIGANVVPAIQKNNGIRALLSTQIRGGEGTTMQLGMLNVDKPMSYVATIGGVGQSLEVWTYRDTVENANGDTVELFDPNSVALIAPGNRGVRAYGAIYDAEAFAEGVAQIDIYPKMWMTKDPGDAMLMNQSAPLMIPLTPNKVLKATVLEEA